MIWEPPTVGEEVWVISPSGDMRSAFIAGSFFNADFPAPSQSADEVVIKHADGTTITHNRSKGEQSIAGLKTLNSTITTTNSNSQVTHQGSLTNQGTFTQSAPATFTAPATMSAGIKGAGGKTIDADHVHDYTDNGNTLTTKGVKS